MRATRKLTATGALTAILIGAMGTVRSPLDAVSRTAETVEAEALLDAAKRGDTDRIRVLLDERVDADSSEADGTTALHWASYHDDLVAADLLLHAGADVNAVNDLGATALWAASQNGSVPMTSKLLSAGADPNVALLSGETPVMVAARSGSADVVAMLASQGADLDARATRDQTALMWAAAQSHGNVVKTLIANGADLSARSAVWNQLMAVPPHSRPSNHRYIPHGGNSALMFSARSGDVDSATLLVDAGADVDDTNAWGVSAVAMAAHAGHTGVVELLLGHGANPDAARAGFAPLHAAVMRRDEHMVRVLLAHGANPNAQVGAWTPRRRASADHNFEPALVGATPYWLAARFAEPGIMRQLASQGADPLFVLDVEYQADYRGGVAEQRHDVTNVVMAAAGMGGNTQRAWIRRARIEPEASVLEAVRVAVELGGVVTSADQVGDTPLHYAAVNGHDQVVTYLVQNGASLTHENDRGETARRAAAARGRGGFTVELLDALELATSH